MSAKGRQVLRLPRRALNALEFPLPAGLDASALWLLLEAASLRGSTSGRALDTQHGAPAWTAEAQRLRAPLTAHIADMRRVRWSLLDRWSGLWHDDLSALHWVNTYTTDLAAIKERMDRVLLTGGHRFKGPTPPPWLQPIDALVANERAARLPAGSRHWAQWADTTNITRISRAWRSLYAQSSAAPVTKLTAVPGFAPRERYPYTDDTRHALRMRLALAQLRRALGAPETAPSAPPGPSAGTPTTLTATLPAELAQIDAVYTRLLDSPKCQRALTKAAMDLSVSGNHSEAPIDLCVALTLEDRTALSAPIAAIEAALLELRVRVGKAEPLLTLGMSEEEREAAIQKLTARLEDLPVLFSDNDSA